MKAYKTLTFKINNETLDIQVDEKTKEAYLSEKQIAKLFQKSRGSIAYQIRRLGFNQTDRSLCLKINQTGADGKQYLTSCYSLRAVSLIGKSFGSDEVEKLQDFINQSFEDSEPFIDDCSNDIIIHNNGTISLAVKVSPEEDTVLLTQSQIAYLFETTKQNVSNHIKNIIEEGELSTVKDFLTVQQNFAQVECQNESENNTNNNPVNIYKIKTATNNNRRYELTYYNLDVILAVGYLVKSKRAINFRRWANSVLKQYLIKGYAIDANRVTISKENFIQMENNVKSLEKRVSNIEEKMFIEPIKERLFFNGQYFDAYEFLVNIVKQAKQSIIIIDPYFDIKGLRLLSNSSKDIKKTICYSSFSKLKNEEVIEFKKQYGCIESIHKDIFHDRFIIVDESICYHIGTSINHIGTKLFGVFKVEDQIFLKGLLDALK